MISLYRSNRVPSRVPRPLTTYISAENLRHIDISTLRVHEWMKAAGWLTMHTNRPQGTLGDIQGVFLGDWHTDQAIRAQNSYLTRLFLSASSSTSIYIEGDSVADTVYMLDTRLFPETIHYKIWDDLKARTAWTSPINVIFNLGILIEKMNERVGAIESYPFMTTNQRALLNEVGEVFESLRRHPECAIMASLPRRSDQKKELPLNMAALFSSSFTQNGNAGNSTLCNRPSIRNRPSNGSYLFSGLEMLDCAEGLLSIFEIALWGSSFDTRQHSLCHNYKNSTSRAIFDGGMAHLVSPTEGFPIEPILQRTLDQSSKTYLMMVDGRFYRNIMQNPNLSFALSPAYLLSLDFRRLPQGLQGIQVVELFRLKSYMLQKGLERLYPPKIF